MSICITPLTLGGLDDLTAHTRRCVFWEIAPELARQAEEFADPTFEKEAWLSMVMLEWGSCGQIASDDGKPAGVALYAPPSAVPRSALFPTSPVSPDAVLLTTLRVEPRFEHTMVSDDLVDAVVADLVRRGVRALEAFGIRRLADDRPALPTATSSQTCSPSNCMIDADVLEEVGFKVIAPHHLYPRLRLDIDHNHDWKSDVEHALDQLMAAAELEKQKVVAC
ncbi:MAG: GNAT family N-acetyltransferase [Mycobacteriaceae bacterium]|nr:GNAT family N-acetyltransferase [Mycobacteriaceae bacterium]